MNAIHFSSKSDEWATPQDFFDKLHAEFNFTLDAAADSNNAKCPEFFTLENSGLDKPWKTAGSVWCNPPYSRGLQAEFIRKAKREADDGQTVVMLIPARTDTKVWHDTIFPFAEVRFVKGRLKFGGCKQSAPFPNAVIIFRGKSK